MEKRIFRPNEGKPITAEGVPVLRENPYKAWVSIMYGCNNFCTYCIVPYVRGRERSRRPEAILQEIRELAADGCREITLLGQNVNSYGKEFGGECDFADLLAKICEIPGDFIVRFMTSHPKDASHKLIDTMAANPKIARQFHLPVQSGSDRILTAMNRHYNRESYLSLIRYMREKMPDIAISTDIIVGFPGETEEDFEDTLSIVKEARYDMMYSFIYSKRSGTPAAEMEYPDQSVAIARAEMVETIQSAIMDDYSEGLIGTRMEILVDGFDAEFEQYFGRTYADSPEIDGRVWIASEEALAEGRFVTVEIDGLIEGDLSGFVVEE